MAISATLATPTTLQPDQELSIIKGKEEIRCFNDSGLKQEHYRTIPNDDSNEGRILWGNKESVKRTDGDYAVAVSMFEYIPDAGTSNIFLYLLQKAAAEGLLVNVPQRGEMYIMPNSVKEENGGHVVFRKRVWVKNSDLILGSVAQQEAMTEEEKKKKQEELDALSKTDPITGNGAGGDSSSTIYWIIGIVFVFIGGIILLFKALGKRKKEQEAKDKANAQSPVNVIRIPKS